jgi:NAD(P)H-flavin reductase
VANIFVSPINREKGEVDVQNPYLPYPVRIEEIITETEDKNLKTFKLVFLNPDDENKFNYNAGQFAELSIAGKGEIPIGIASSPTEKGFLMFTVNKVGLVTSHLHNMKPGDIMGVRGPLGNWYPWDIMEGKNVIIIGGGFAFTTLRSSIIYMLDPANRSKFGDIHVIYGARTPGMLLTGTNFLNGKNGMISTCILRWTPPMIQTGSIMSVLCRPLPTRKLDYAHDHIIMSLEMRMKCGIGICGRCNIGKEFVCKDGPVFTLDQLNSMPKEY